MTLKKGQIVVSKHGIKRTVMETLGSLVSLSLGDRPEQFYSWRTIPELIEKGYIWEEPDWFPEEKQSYFFITASGTVGEGCNFNSKMTKEQASLFGVYPTRKRAEMEVVEIRRKLGKV